MGTQRARNLRSSLRENTQTKALDTTDQYTAMLRFFANSEIHISTICAKESRAPRFGTYAN